MWMPGGVGGVLRWGARQGRATPKLPCDLPGVKGNRLPRPRPPTVNGAHGIFGGPSLPTPKATTPAGLERAAEA